MYTRRDLDRLEFPALPDSAAGKRGWFAAVTTQLSAIDMTATDVLTRWILATNYITGSSRDVMPLFHTNSQGLNLLDRHVGKLMASPANQQHRIFGIQFASYIEWCHAQQVAPRGRVFVAMVAIWFRLDRNRGKCINIVHMLNIPLPSYKTMDVKAFVDKVRLCLVNLSTEELKDKQLLYQWLYEKFRRYNAIQNKLDKIRESRTGSRKRTWGYLWGAITSYLDNLYEDDNYDNLALGLQHHKINAAPAQKTRADKRQKATEAKTHTDREQTAARSRSDALQQPSQLSKRAQKKSEKATSAAAAASGATASFGGKGSKGKSAGKGKAESDPTDPASVARSKAHDERTTEEKRLIPCRFEALGTCYAGNNCAYSHDKKLIVAVKAKAKPKSKMAAAKKTLATVASMAGLGADGAVTTTIPTPSKPAWCSPAAVLKCVWHNTWRSLSCQR